MAKKIRISGAIGWETTTEQIIEQLGGAGGEDLDITVASVGGDVFTGVEIFNLIRDYKRQYPSAGIVITAKGVAASMASYIMMISAYVGGISAAEDNAVFMVHNPWNFTVGDYREMRRNADFLEGVTGLLAKAYIKQTEKEVAEIRGLMDEETWLFGQQIKDAGFVDEMVKSDSEPEPTEEDAAAAIAAAKLKYRDMLAQAKDHSPKPERVAAIMREIVPPKQEPKKTVSDTPAVGGNKKTTPEGGRRKSSMDLEQLKKEHPEAYAAILALGKAEGVKQERERISKGIALMKKPEIAARKGIVDRVLDGIEKGEDHSEIVLSATSMLTAALESPGTISSGQGPDTPTGELPKGAAGERQPVMEV